MRIYHLVDYMESQKGASCLHPEQRANNDSKHLLGPLTTHFNITSYNLYIIPLKVYTKILMIMLSPTYYSVFLE